MTRTITSKTKYERTIGESIYGKGNSSVHKRPTKPGQHGKKNVRRKSNFCLQLRETKKLRLFYGYLTHKYLIKIYKLASKERGNKIDNLVSYLEGRLSTFVYRAKWAKTIYQAKQLVSHGWIKVNGKKVDINSYLLKPNDIIEISDKILGNPHFQESMKYEHRGLPNFYEYVNDNKTACKFLGIKAATSELFPTEMRMKLIIEYLSKF
ncbi:hypothetical protein AB836_01970 [Rickettsiales bacterium (ex Bugula neritina AB1)]|nr:hypothetical protein AB836_01970 [Rickettsiales bacterium (ex Bugula neritina AB1)]